MTYTIKAKIKQSKRLETWYTANATQAAKLYNECLKEQFVRASHGLRLFTSFDLINKFRAFPLGSDFKDQTIERAVKAAHYRQASLSEKGFARLCYSCQ